MFDTTSDHFSPSTSAFMINYAVDDMDAMVKRHQDHGVTALTRTGDDAFGRYAWIVDRKETRWNCGSLSASQALATI